MKGRYETLDTLRGVTILSMIAFHGCWDLVYLAGFDWPWYHSDGAYLWQQSICWTFILLSGYCVSMGRHRLKRGLWAFGGGAIVSAVTLFVMPESPVLFGVLTLLGSAGLLMVPLERHLRKIPPRLGLVLSFCGFMLVRDVSMGALGFEGMEALILPQGLYRNLLTAYLGFPPAGFFSTDYFPLLPWLALYLTGYYLYRACPPEGGGGIRLPVITWMGRHSLLIYLLHQPVLYGLCAMLFL